MYQALEKNVKKLTTAINAKENVLLAKDDALEVEIFHNLDY
jgi:hypothetical protein